MKRWFVLAHLQLREVSVVGGKTEVIVCLEVEVLTTSTVADVVIYQPLSLHKVDSVHVRFSRGQNFCYVCD